MDSKEYYTDFEYTDFDLFISSLKHQLKSLGAEAFIHKYESEPAIAEKHKLLYLVSMIKTIGKENRLTLPEWISIYDKVKMDKLLFPHGTILYTKLTNDESMLKDRQSKAIKEFMDHNLIEISLKDVM